MGSAQGRPQHHDEPEGRRQAGELHRGLRRAAGAPGRVHRRADRGVPQARQRAAPGTPTPRSARCTCGRSWTCDATGAAKMRAIAEEASALVRRFKGAYSGEHGDGLCRGEWIEWQFGPKITQAFAQIKQQLDPLEPAQPEPHRRSAEDGRHAADALFHRAYKVVPAAARARLERLGRAERPGHGRDHRARHRRRPGAGSGQGRGDVQQQRPLPQVRRRHHVPELPRHARREAPDPRARQHCCVWRSAGSSKA